MNNDYPRLCEEPTEPPAPLNFSEARARADSTTDSKSADSVAMAEAALERAQQALDSLDELADQMIIPFPGRDAQGDDDGPRAA